MQSDNYKGYSLFNDITDAELRNRNRAVTMCNIILSNLDKETKKITLRGTDLVLNYFNLVPKEDRAEVSDGLVIAMEDRGFYL